MAQFMAEARGDGQPVHRLGSKASGAAAKAQGWDFGVKVRIAHAAARDSEVVSILLTGGSNGSRETIWLLDVDSTDRLDENADKLREAADYIMRHPSSGWPR